MMAVPYVKRNVSLLALCHGYAQTSVTIVITVSALAGAMIAEDKSLATLPHAFMWMATAAAAMPASLLMKRFGRRHGFAMGSLLGLLGCALCTLGVYVSDLWVFIAGTACMGAFNSFNQYLRFAAAEASDAEFRPKAIALVIGGGVLTGFALYLFSDVVFALGLSDSIPVTLAAWSPSGVALLLGLTTLLHLEDG